MKVLSIILLFTFLLGYSKGLECGSEQDQIQSRLDALSKYVPGATPTPKPTRNSDANMGGMGGMGGMGKGDTKRDGETQSAPALPTDCLYFSPTSDMITVNCESHICVSALLDLVQDYETIFTGSCTAETGFTADPQLQKTMKKLKDLPTCNKCAVSYTKFNKIEASLKATGCFPTTSQYSCDSNCLKSLADYQSMWTAMLGGQCHMDNPGGCGETGGPTEGEIYDKLNTMHTQMKRISTVISYCDPFCKNVIDVWYADWQTMIDAGCISSSTTELSSTALLLESFSLDTQCNEECHDKIEQLRVHFYQKVSIGCGKGLTSSHKDELSDSVNPDACSEGEGWTLTSEMTVAKAFFGLGILGVGVIAIYLIGGIVYNRCVLGKRGWDILPSFRWGSSTKNGHRRLRNIEEDDEEVLFESYEDK